MFHGIFCFYFSFCDLSLTSIAMPLFLSPPPALHCRTSSLPMAIESPPPPATTGITFCPWENNPLRPQRRPRWPLWRRWLLLVFSYAMSFNQDLSVSFEIMRDICAYHPKLTPYCPFPSLLRVGHKQSDKMFGLFNGECLNMVSLLIFLHKCWI